MNESSRFIHQNFNLKLRVAPNLSRARDDNNEKTGRLLCVMNEMSNIKILRYASFVA